VISAGRIADGIALAFDMARGKSGWEDRHDLSADAVFASFWAFLLIVPGSLVRALVGRQMAAESPVPQASAVAALSPTMIVVIKLSTLLLGLAAQVYLLTRLARRRSTGWRVSPLIIAFIWATFAFETVLGSLMGVLALVGLPFLSQLAALVVFGMFVWALWGILREGLQTTPLGTFGTLMLLLVVLMLVNLAVSAVFSVFNLLPEVAAPGGEVPANMEADPDL
jgi:hypothetical protein